MMSADNTPQITIFQKLMDWKIILLSCLTLGLAPFVPEPHILGKIRWIAGGAHGMQFMDLFDTVFHGWPWVLLVVKTFHSLIRSIKTS